MKNEIVVLEAIDEATILELGREQFDLDHMLITAQKLCGASYSEVFEVYHDRLVKKYHDVDTINSL